MRRSIGATSVTRHGKDGPRTKPLARQWRLWWRLRADLTVVRLGMDEPA
jgi:hypothetical protein